MTKKELKPKVICCSKTTDGDQSKYETCMKTGEFTFESTKETKYNCLVKTEVGEDERDACCRRNWAVGSAREQCFSCTRSTCPNQFVDPDEKRKPVLKAKN